MQKFNKLSKAEMKQISGAGRKAAPSSPMGVAVAQVTSSDCSGRMCCWEDEWDNCSDCVEGATDSWTCVDGAYLGKCGDCQV